MGFPVAQSVLLTAQKHEFDNRTAGHNEEKKQHNLMRSPIERDKAGNIDQAKAYERENQLRESKDKMDVIYTTKQLQNTAKIPEKMQQLINEGTRQSAPTFDRGA